VKISVVIPVYNCAATIRATLNSVLRQTLSPCEIIVLDDGSTDQTASILRSYEPEITVIPGKHEGTASARNTLCLNAKGDLVAFLDHDDLWHSKYLETRSRAFEAHPEAVAFFSGHLNFVGRETEYEWTTDPTQIESSAELISQQDFFRRYNETTGLFASMSYCCVPKSILTKIGVEPFKTNPTEDSYLMYQLALLGPVFYESTPLVAFRIIEGSSSSNRLLAFGSWVNAFELLEGRYKESADAKLRGEFEIAFASRRRSYAKILMGAGRTMDARAQLHQSVDDSNNPLSVAKSLAMLGTTYLPKALQPSWPPPHRVWTPAEESPSAKSSMEKA
jgi:glycosyltransferase involved in cell wall biosynthesis